MEITKVIVKGGENYGMFIQDGAETYPVRIESLHTPLILDTLMAEGWELYSLPYDIRKGSLTLDDLPKISYEEAHITEEQEQDMIDMMSQRYKEVDLKAKLVKSPVNYIQFKQGTNQIKTREELVEFLKTTVQDNIDLNISRAYIPLNSFVAPTALLTPEEYFSPEYAEVRSLIEKRRVISFKNFERLVSFLIATGLPEDYTSKQLIEAYFQWGFCGIRFDAYDRKRERTNLILGSKVHHSLEEEEMPYVRMSHLTYMNSDGTIHKTPTLQTGRWIPLMKEGALEAKRRELMQQGYEYVAPLYLEATIDEEVTIVTGDDMIVEYTDDRLLYTYNGTSHSTHTIRVRRLDNAFKFLPSRYWNIKSEQGREKLFEEFYINALCREITKKITVLSDASSYKALRTIGAGPLATFNYMLEKNPQFKDVMGEGADKDEKDLLALRVESYLKGTLNPSLPYYSDVENFVQDVIDGSVNIDNTADGQESDSMSGADTIYQVIAVATRLLGVPLDTIYEQVKDLNPDIPYIDFKGEGKTVRLPIVKRDAKLKGYTADCKNYKRQQAREAKEWHWVTRVFRELGPESDKLRHAAVEVLTFYRDKKSEAIENFVLNIVNDAIADNVPYMEQGDFKDFIYMITANALFEAGLQGTITFPPALGGKVMSLPKDQQEAIASYFDTEFDSTVAVSETTINARGEFNRYCVNAVVTPEFVIPNKGFSINEYPLIPIWLNTAGMDEFRRKWAQEGLIPSPNFYGYSNYYTLTNEKGVALIRGSRDWKNDPMSLVWYYNNSEDFRKNFPTDMEFTVPPHMIEVLYPSLYQDVENNAYVERRDKAAIGQLHKFKLGGIVKITRESIFERFPQAKEIFEAQPKAPEGRREGFWKFTGYSAEDFYFLKTFDNLKASPNFQGKKQLAGVISKDKAFLNNEGRDDITHLDVERLSEEEYAVTHLCGRKYLMEDVTGNLWEVHV